MDSTRFFGFQFFQTKFNTLLCSAAQDGYTNSVIALLAAGANPNACDEHGYTALMLAARNDHISIVTALLSANADVNAVMTPPSLAKVSYQTLTQRIETLLNTGAKASAPNDLKQTAIVIAFENGHEEIAEILKQKGAELPAGYSPTHHKISNILK
jgi:ankyrin repeat protein